MKKYKPLLWGTFTAGITLLVCFHFSGAADFPNGGGSALEVRAAAGRSREPMKQWHTAEYRRAREKWEVERHGFNLGVPERAYANAMNQRLRMEAQSLRERAAGISKPA